MPIPSLFTAAGALTTQQNAISVIANNIANVNTTSFKSSSVHFAEETNNLLRPASSASSTKGGTNPNQIGTGVKLSDINTIFSQGSLKSTGLVTDLAIAGNGFFVTSNATPDGSTDLISPQYTRDGHFLLDADSNLVTADGAKVMGATIYDNGSGKIKSITGYSAVSYFTDQTIGPAGSPTMYPTDGGISPNLAVPAPTTTVLGGGVAPAFDATKLSEISVRGGLVDPSTGVTTTTPGDLTVSRRDDGKLLFTFDDAVAGTSASTFTAAVDSGARYLDNVLSFNMTNSSGDTLQLRIRLEPGTTSIEDVFQNIDYNASTGVSDTMKFTGAAATTQDGSDITVANADFEYMSLNDLSGLYGTIKVPNFLYDQDPTLEKATASFAIGADGSIAVFGESSEKMMMGRLLVTNFVNPDGLSNIGNNKYVESSNSGQSAISVLGGPFDEAAPSTGATKIVSGSLESSNVNVANEFAELIAFQRGLQFNATTIQRSDEILQTLINL
jgi:flagellar hook protein FlgE